MEGEGRIPIGNVAFMDYMNGKIIVTEGQNISYMPRI
jgi:hypothetical protein